MGATTQQKKSAPKLVSVPAVNHAQLIQPYQDLSNGDILESMLILIITLLLFLALMVSSGFVLQKWQADLFGFSFCGIYFVHNTVSVRNQLT